MKTLYLATIAAVLPTGAAIAPAMPFLSRTRVAAYSVVQQNQNFFIGTANRDVATFTGAIDVTWTDSLGATGTIVFSGVKGPNADFDCLGIVATDGERLKSVEVLTPGSESFKQLEPSNFHSSCRLSLNRRRSFLWEPRLVGLRLVHWHRRA
jgi:hypothetical protein